MSYFRDLLNQINLMRQVWGRGLCAKSQGEEKKTAIIFEEI